MEKLKFFGMRYAVETVKNAHREYQELLTYRIYITESIRLKAENKCITAKYTDLINWNREPEKSAEEVKRNILEEFRRLGGENNGN